jgi:hypothetical protein
MAATAVPSASPYQLGALSAATVMVIVLVGWWAGFFG